MTNIYLPIPRILARYAWDLPNITFFGAMPHPGPNKTTYLDVYCDAPAWKSMLDAPPIFLGIVNEAHVCDIERAVKWRNGQQPLETPDEATHRNETLVHVEMPFADYEVYNALLRDMNSFLVPPSVSMTVFGDTIPYRKPLCVRTINLNGQNVDVETIQPIDCFDRTVEKPMLYERGLPVFPLDLPFHVNLLAVLKYPLPPALIKDLMNHLG